MPRAPVLRPLAAVLVLQLLQATATGQQVPAPPAPPPVLKTPAGALQGAEQDGVRRFLGIPYAQAPVGELRWRPPRPLAPWSGTRAALQFGAECMQGRSATAPVPMSEDCLFLNIWLPSRHAGRRLPVLVWVHGGAFKVGTASQPLYDGAELARRGMVVVTLNYRLGRFGFLAHPALTHETPQGPLGNYGLLDVIEALKWVRTNIGAFGGDPRKVTLAGQSAGGAAVYDLLTSPLARDLFARAIIESGVFRTPTTTFAAAEQAGAAAASTWDAGATDAASLRRLSAAQVQGEGPPLAGSFGPMVDGTVLPGDVPAAFDAGQIAPVPLLIGSNSEEARFFPAAASGLSQRLASAWPRISAVFDGYGTHRTDLVEMQLATDMLLTAPTRTAARAATAAGSPTFLYYYSYVRPAQRAQTPGASHIDEVYALFGHMELMPGNDPDAANAAIVTAVQERWARFVSTGDPGTPTQPWPKLALEQGQLLEFGNDGEFVREDFASQRLDLAAAIP
jgi:para-nitrobenzyl esterase